MCHMLGIAESLELCPPHRAVAVDGSGECSQDLMTGDRSVSKALLAIRESDCNAVAFSARGLQPNGGIGLRCQGAALCFTTSASLTG
jgi:hypothetical protein